MNSYYSFKLSTRLTGLFCFVVFGIGMSGCNSAENEPENSTETSTEEQPQVAKNELPEKSLVGIWLGFASINQEKLKTLLDSTEDPGTRNQLLQIANSFMTTQMGAEFSENGELKFDLEFRATNGELLEGTSWGTWKLVKQNNEFVIIEKTESFDDGTSETKIVRYDFRTPTNPPAGNTQTTTASAESAPDQFEFAYPHPDLKDCEPKIIFERKVLGQTSIPKVADQNGLENATNDQNRQ